MYYTVYASCASSPFTKQQLVDLLNQSRENNEKLDITGILLYNRGTFIQMLEGDESSVKNLYKKIDKDPRHKLIFTLMEGHKEERQFPNWSMAFRDLDSPEIQKLPGFSNFINEPLDSTQYYRDPMAALELLYMFRDVVK
jgi:hypothetical protein